MATTLATVNLFGTSGCHLCEEVEAILCQAGVAAAKIDILDDDKLFDKYSLRIPVLKRIDNGAELNWPFDADSVLRFLQ